jgi:flavin reductase (DIM6/NTAB) family NADH-FMN oxidoreductase RutF
MFAPTGQKSGRVKDSLNNVHATREFVANMAAWALRDFVWLSSTPAPPEVDEFDVTGLTPVLGRLVVPPRVKESPAHLECQYVQTVTLPHTGRDNANHVVIGRVVGIHIDDSFLVNGLVDQLRIKPMARLGYTGYTQVTEVHAKPFPTWPPLA